MSPAAPRTDHTHVLLLRGINVGRSNRVGKDTLIRWAQAAGGEAVTTHLASGNVLFRASSDAAAEGVRQGFARRAREEGGLDVPVVLVDVGTLRRALELHDALPWAGGEPKRTQLTVLEDDPAPEAAAALAALDHGDDTRGAGSHGPGGTAAVDALRRGGRRLPAHSGPPRPGARGARHGPEPHDGAGARGAAERGLTSADGTRGVRGVDTRGTPRAGRDVTVRSHPCDGVTPSSASLP